jgi:hypothetical protein
MSDSRPVQLTPSGPPETVLDPEPAAALAALGDLPVDPDEARRVVTTTVARYPRCLAAWATLGDLGRDPVERYAAYRVGYHRGLDRLRANGWRGSGYVRWSHDENRGFLRALAGLAAMAAAIDEADEAERCELFLRQLDPAWPPADLPSA